MIRRLPVLPTLIVLIAAGVMIRLGFWQLDRLHQKEALLESFAGAQRDPAELADRELHLNGPTDGERLFYHRARFTCSKVIGWQAIAGRNRDGEAGIAHVAKCMSPHILRFDGPDRDADIVLGWSNNPENPAWSGGEITGIVSPGGELGFRIVADPPLAGLAASARPDPVNVPNNHLSYAVQWFLFAGLALVIYGLAVRKRLAAGSPQG